MSNVLRPRGRRRAVLAALVAGLLALGLGRPVEAGASPTQTAPDPATPILAIVSPLASPACLAAGSATLLVPILGGLVGDTLGISGSVNVADLVLDVIGPLYVVCGTLPASPGTRCALDANIAGLWPAELTGFGVSAPIVVGNVIDTLTAVLALLGLPPSVPVAQALQCDVAKVGANPEVPPATPPPTGVVTVPGAPGGDLGLPPAVAASLPLLLTSPAEAAPAPPRVPVGGSLASTLDEQLPGGLHALQVVVAVALLATLSRCWWSSWRLARLDR